jgi:hypothetical protein
VRRRSGAGRPAAGSRAGHAAAAGPGSSYPPRRPAATRAGHARRTTTRGSSRPSTRSRLSAAPASLSETEASPPSLGERATTGTACINASPATIPRVGPQLGSRPAAACGREARRPRGPRGPRRGGRPSRRPRSTGAGAAAGSSIRRSTRWTPRSVAAISARAATPGALDRGHGRPPAPRPRRPRRPSSAGSVLPRGLLDGVGREAELRQRRAAVPRQDRRRPAPRGSCRRPRPACAGRGAGRERAVVEQRLVPYFSTLGETSRRSASPGSICVRKSRPPAARSRW